MNTRAVDHRASARAMLGAGRRLHRTFRGDVRGRVPVLGTALVILGLGVVASVAYGALRTPVQPPPSGGPPAVPLSVVVTVRSDGGIDQVSPANLVVPVGVPVRISIVNLDTASAGGPAAAAAVAGDFVGPVVLRDPDSAAFRPFTALPPSAISHTFSLEGGAYNLNIPVPAAGADGAAAEVDFSMYFNETGTFVWECWAFCHDGGLGGTADMGGRVTVGPS